MSRQPLLFDQYEAFLQSQNGRGEGPDDDSPDVSAGLSNQPQSKPFFPPAIIIRSHDPVPHIINTTDPSLSPPREGVTYPPKAQEWKDWNINPAHHGVPSRGPPVFVPSKGNYDELGRSVMDGAGVEVDMGVRAVREGRENGESVAGWYTALSRGRTPEAGGIVTKTNRMRATIVVPQDQAIDLTADSDDEGEPEVQDAKDKSPTIPSLSEGNASPSQQAMPAQDGLSDPLRPLRIRRDEWFIRRALLKSHQTALPTPKTAGSSIGSMLDDSPIEVRNIKFLPRYVLGPENKGYTILKDQLGWGGGGLGKPAGWVGDAPTPTPALTLMPTDDIVDPLDGNHAIDLTLSSDESDLDATPPPTPPSGPGRTAPIATSLKLDKLGLGHRRNPRDHQGNLLKRVTHTHEQIERAARRKPVERLELGKKGKIKWKEKDRKERDERRRIAAFLNA